jgi:hypothetical protein
LKKCKLPGGNQIPAEHIPAEGEAFSTPVAISGA